MKTSIRVCFASFLLSGRSPDTLEIPGGSRVTRFRQTIDSGRPVETDGWNVEAGTGGPAAGESVATAIGRGG